MKANPHAKGRLPVQPSRIVKHSQKMGRCRKSLSSNGLRHILHVVSRKIRAIRLGIGGA
ncbi:TPA: hypothetical protein QDC03_007775 [Burkholderia cepacia]|uniref:hypothetical protein n=1 Tax=Burkholderia cepacia TaxID=292 RepID=UPI0015E322AB|nr:hypothetical protein [Burkholderia cepacia]HDR9510965.1 hypothetical protein [Burkholderia cepacia]HDR9512473.1 hypothetical protein [Burkholderia cepacia]